MEKMLFSTLKDLTVAFAKTTQEIHTIGEAKSATTYLLVAGGWVRDKLLGHKSRDLDLISAKGVSKYFAANLKFAFEKLASSNGYRLVWKDPPTIIMQIPACKDQELMRIKVSFIKGSKVETESDLFKPFEIDIRELKDGETYEEDAYKRDFKMNALYYDFISDKVLDCVDVG